MIRLEIKMLILTNKGERKIKMRNIIGKLSDIETPPKGLRSPLLAIKNPQKNAHMLLIEPTSSPNAKGSLHPSLTGIAENMCFGEKSTDLIVCFIPFHKPSSRRLSQGVALLFPVALSSSFIKYSNLFPHCGHFIHFAPGGIFSSGILFV
jgi:hypothetical protein